MERERLGSRLGFILLSAGCAIGIGNVWKFFATLSSEEFILFAFSYTESCRYSINVLN